MKSYKNTNDPQRSFVTVYVEKHSKKNQFFIEINKIINWESIDSKLKKVYTKGLKERGAKAYSPLLLFKMQLISIWYDLSDIQTEAMVNDSISALNFCDLSIEDDVPGHSTLSRFRKVLIEQKAYDKLLDEINQQLSEQQLSVIIGHAKMDAKLTTY